MFVTKKKHEAAIKHYRDLFEARGVVITDRDQTIGRLQRENARLLAELSTLKSARARSNGNLIPGGPKAKARAAAERGGVAS
ncbi:hypothetical protein [Sphingobium sp. TCM1]|uniref:hypothetical protein n=1 Tax=Sphingobium sp. TCM1 TaxID=453246 RepID=UPI0007F49B48|nr:hypothetical protein [Sphingobium sp. TCM1]OAN52837.1 hypothetical protein A7Q26_06475 [Sphingobium sp. TCM1]